MFVNFCNEGYFLKIDLKNENIDLTISTKNFYNELLYTLYRKVLCVHDYVQNAHRNSSNIIIFSSKLSANLLTLPIIVNNSLLSSTANYLPHDEGMKNW